MDSFKTISQPSEGLYKEKGSKFIGKAFPVNTWKEAKIILTDLRKTYHDARHHCFAFRLSENAYEDQVSDDGEPKHTAGDPIMGQIRSYGLCYILLVVIRYFGGTKLGKSGLIQAYKTAAREALEQAEIIVRTPIKKLKISFHYEDTFSIQKIIKNYDLQVLEERYHEKCFFTLAIPEYDYNTISKELQLWSVK